MKRTSPAGIIALDRRGGGGEAWLEEDDLLLQRLRAELWAQLPPPKQVPAVLHGAHDLHSYEGGVGTDLPRWLAKVREGGQGSDT